METPATPAISLIQALNKQMDNMLAKDWSSAGRATPEMADLCKIGRAKHFKLYGDEKFLSKTVTNVENTAQYRSGRPEQGVGLSAWQ